MCKPYVYELWQFTSVYICGVQSVNVCILLCTFCTLCVHSMFTYVDFCETTIVHSVYNLYTIIRESVDSLCRDSVLCRHT